MGRLGEFDLGPRIGLVAEEGTHTYIPTASRGLHSQERLGEYHNNTTALYFVRVREGGEEAGQAGIEVRGGR